MVHGSPLKNKTPKCTTGESSEKEGGDATSKPLCTCQLSYLARCVAGSCWPLPGGVIKRTWDALATSVAELVLLFWL